MLNMKTLFSGKSVHEHKRCIFANSFLFPAYEHYVAYEEDEKIFKEELRGLGINDGENKRRGDYMIGKEVITLDESEGEAYAESESDQNPPENWKLGSEYIRKLQSKDERLLKCLSFIDVLTKLELNVKNSKFLFVPINVDNKHWVAAFFNLYPTESGDSGHIYYYDSFNCRDKTELVHKQDMIISLYTFLLRSFHIKERIIGFEGKMYIIKDGLAQKDKVNCALFVCFSAERLSRLGTVSVSVQKPPSKDFIEKMRRYLAYSIQDGKIYTAEDEDGKIYTAEDEDSDSDEDTQSMQ